MFFHGFNLSARAIHPIQGEVILKWKFKLYFLKEFSLMKKLAFNGELIIFKSS